MNNNEYENIIKPKLWKKVLCVILSLIIALGTFITLTFGSSRFQNWLGIQSMLSAYASEIVDTKGAIAVNKESMLADNHIIDLECKDGSNVAYIFSEPISYTDENGDLKTKDISVEKQSDKELKAEGYDYTNGQNDYRINFSKDSSKGLLVEFGTSSYAVIPESDLTVTGNENTSIILNEEFEDFEYENIYGEGTNLKFYPQLNGVKDEIVLNSNIGKNAFSFTLKTKNCKAVLNEDDTVSLISNDDESSVQTFSAPFAYDSEYVEGDKNNHYIDCKYLLEETAENTYTLTVSVDNEWLNNPDTVYPVVIDPTTSNITLSADAGVYSKYSSNNYGSEQTCCFGRASDYGYGSVYTKFTVPSAIKKGAKINSAYQWMRETTGRSTTTYVTPYMVTSSWSETGIKWSNKASYNTSVAGTKKNINSKSKDDPDNSYWYKFNIAGAVKKWVDGTANYGVAYVSSDATSSGAYNWRAFTSRTYSSSAMRPYTVISYTNDATAPTVTSVTGNPTAWTKNNVTLTVNGAKDNSGGAGMHSTPYSFSTTKSSYSWQSGNTKTFSSNCTVYVYVRDALGNIRLVSTQTINKIDKTAPTAPKVTGAPTAWTNQNYTLTASTTESGSGVAGYSFSTQSGTYSWQTGNTKQYTGNGTVYVYAKDNAGNISTVTTVKVDKVDKVKPVISDVSITKNAETGKTTVTITATDALSGIAGYSFDGGKTYQTANSKALDTVPNTISVAVKDNANNIATQVSEAILPEFYEDGNLVGILNPNTDSNEKLQYKIGEDGEWTEYAVPFAVPLNQTTTIYARVGESESVISKAVTPDTSSIGTYSESNTDFSLTYKNVSFDFTRTYDSVDKKWFFATDSNVTVINDYVISAVLPDSTELTFIKTADNTYTNEINGYTLTSNDNGYILQIDDVNYAYDTDGKIISISNKYDDTITIARTESSITITDGADRAYTLALDSNGNIVSVTDPANNAITYTYDGNNLTKVVDQAGVTLGQYSYTNGVLTKSMDKTIVYNSDGRVASDEYDSGAYLNYTYDDENKTISTESSVETTTSQTYNDALLITSSTDEEGNTTEYTYDEYYRTLTETKDGKTVTYTYDAKGNVLSEVSDDEDAENTYYIYDTNGNVIRQQTGKNYTYSVYNDDSELIISASLKENYTGAIPEKYSTDLTCFDTVTYTYENGILIKSVDSKTNETVTNTYDEYGNSVKVTTVTEKDGSSTVGSVDSTYDIMGNLLTSISGDETSSYIYDKAGRTLLANEKGDCTRTIYDNLGRTIQEISPEDYDSTKDGLPAENTYADSKAGQTYKYAANGTLTSETNRLGKTTKYYYNDIGSKIREEFDIYKFYYLNHGELYQVKVANTTTVSYSYDNKFKLISETYANDEVVRYTYNDNGDLTAQYHNSNAKPYVTYTYNADNELTEKVNTDTGLKYVYGENNKVDVYRTSNNTLVQSYTETETEADESNNIDAKTDITESHFGISYSSVVKDKSISCTTGSNTIEYSYQTTGTDEEEKISSDTVKIGEKTILSSSYTYDDKGNILSKSYGENNEAVNTYDDKNRITSTSYAGKTINYTYDTDDQLTAVNGDNYTASYLYDGRGNITSKTVNGAETTFTYANSGWKDLLIAVNDIELTYDEVGNVLTYGDREFTWNTGRNLESVIDGDNEYSYTYDENGVRTSKTVNGVTTYYNIRNGVIISQSDGTNTMYFQYDTSGTPLGFIYNGTQYFYITNQMGDVLAITDANGIIVGYYEYDAWGAVTLADSDIANLNPIRYRGYYYDTETGYYYLQSRYYDASICRFINADIIEMAQVSKNTINGANIFAYCDNNPINNSDPDGCLKIPNWVKIAIGVGGIVAAVIATIASGGAALPALISVLKKVAGAMAISMAIEGIIGYIVGGRQGLRQGLIDGAINGFMWGGITSALSAISKIISINKYGQVKSSNCFVEDTLISTEFGLIPIQEIAVGDKVYSANPDNNEIELKSVSKTFISSTYELVYVSINGDEIATTKEHPFYVNNYGWIKADSLNVGDELLTKDGSILYVEDIRIETLDEPIKVYNFEVKDFHTYFVSDSNILVHNACGFNNIRTLKETKIKGYKVSMDVERGGSGLINIHLKVDGIKYFWKSGKFVSKSGRTLPNSIKNSAIIQNALKKALDYIKDKRI
ncbi:MAG: polymorphic toxin-type HINT domain-containing protein [Acetobacter sp.]|nr:polymorphic toxin-type HINT domain-containing protein [Bacteroides sp.]MCM1342090.1 polymorphic toxin-type HINT domain-containing protein [Acetobacter sp.]MCM1434301.1 polymorphic toxin-type HINT domain-containing protein [Clostridiales bacterium]